MNTKQMNKQEKLIKKIMSTNYKGYNCHIDNCISYKRRGNTRRLKFYKLYDILKECGVTATFPEAKHIVFKYRANESRVKLNR